MLKGNSDAGLRVLVRCRAGMSRSSLVAALLLVAMNDMNYDDAVSILRDKRHHLVLCNAELLEFGARLAADPGFRELIVRQTRPLD